MKFSKKPAKDEVHLRSNYIDHSRRFLDWVDQLGFERTFIGRWASEVETRFGLRRIGILFLFSLMLSFLLFADFEVSFDAKIGNVATMDIKSPLSFQIVDELATESKRNEVEKSVAPVFDYDPEIYQSILTNVSKAFWIMRQEIPFAQWPNSGAKRVQNIKEAMVLKPKFEKELGSVIPDASFEWLLKKEFSLRIERVLTEGLVRWSQQRIVDIPTNFLPEDSSALILRQITRRGDGGQESTLKWSEVLDIKRAGDLNLEGVRYFVGLGTEDKKSLTQLAHALVVPNTNFNRQETTDRRQKVRDTVLPVQISIKKNQTIVTEGTIIQPLHLALIKEIENLRSNRRMDFVALISACLFVLLILAFFSYMRRFTTNRIKVLAKDIMVMGLVTVFVVAIVKLFLYTTNAAFLSKFGSMPSSVFLYSAPVAAGPMLVGLLITSGEIVFLFTVFLVVCLALMVDMNFGFLLVSLISGMAAARGVYECKKRNDIYWAGVRTGILSAIAITLVVSLQKLGDADLLEVLIWTVPAGFVGGILSSMVAMMIVPLLETWFNYTTDVKLLELASLNHPLMKEMIVKAPGTYHHSLIVGSLVEAAAEEINANALLAKVMAYYHDIGKMHHAHYFIENQRQGYNPHEQISPHMSKTVLIAHVKDGAEMGLEHKLGKPIIDGILQHHGTTLISYFYNKALQEQDDDIDHVESDDFRYPGPKPQFREAALVMLGDSIEAAARSLDEPTPARLQNLVKNIIQSKFLDGQLDECNLTLKDLSVIEATFKRAILGIYHQRIDYPATSHPAGKPHHPHVPQIPKGKKSNFSA